MYQILWYILLLFYIPSCIGLIVIVLLQKGKGVGFAGAFGVGSGSDTVFGPRMSKTLPQRLTYIMAALFMIIALTMSLIAGRMTKGAAPSTVAETSTSQPDLSGLKDLGSAVSGSGGTVSVTPGGTVTATPEGGAAAAAPEPAPNATGESPAAAPLAQTPITGAPPAPENPAPAEAPASK